jgi:Type I site-specific restriction-modification system, R (restriction) subunit and related helicases
MSEILHVRFINCYGIKKLDYQFNFSKKNIFAVYAPNGTMKTSFAKTCKDYIAGSQPKDMMFPDRPSTSSLLDDQGNNLAIDELLVIEPYNEKYKSDKVSTLLVNQELRERYERILTEIEQEKHHLFIKLKQLSGITARDNSIETSLASSFGKKTILETLLDLEETVTHSEDTQFSNVIYNKIFDEKVVAFLNTRDFKKQIKSYIEKYDTLISSTKYLKKGFNHYNVNDIQKSLTNNGFFQAQHTVNLFNGQTKDEVASVESLQEIIQQEMDKILNDEVIAKEFHDIDAKLTTAQLREFRDYLFENKHILPELADLEGFKKKIWTAYLVEQKNLFTNLVEVYKSGKQEIEEIIEVAKAESTDWQDVITIFNKRFKVPFQLEMKNQEDVILKSASPNLNFIFHDQEIGESQPVTEADLMKVLSQGEKRAFYLLNIIFEVRARHKSGQRSYFIIDDIADSFDYKNKYAIIEYLNDISETANFYQIILTHNFDFFRTIQSRMLGGTVQRDNSMIAERTATEIKMVTAGHKNITNPFSIWKKKLNTCPVTLIATIPFVRNLVEFREGNKSPAFNTLTALLHIKDESASITIADLKAIYVDCLKDVEMDDFVPNKSVQELIYEACEGLVAVAVPEGILLENKVALSMGIRLIAEQIMWFCCTNKSAINKNQTHQLFSRFKIEHGAAQAHVDKIKLCELVNLMTPENIHLNSFMYEPILDMSNEHLRQLYLDLKEVKVTLGA